MSRNSSVAIDNNFSKGLVTEASGLNFPENACTETYDCNFELTGEVSRRSGINYEFNNAFKTINRSGNAIKTYLWRNATSDGNISLWVVQVGSTLFFYDVSQSSSITQGPITATVNLTTFQPGGAPSPAAVECQFSDGNGYLFVTHPTLDSFFVSYDSTSQTFTATKITLKIRDTNGLTEAVADDNRPTGLTNTHKYNICNQGWPFSGYSPFTSSTSITAGTGSRTLTVSAGGPWSAGDSIYVWSQAGWSSTGNFNYMIGTVTSYSGTTLVINVTGASSTGAQTDWQIADKPDYIQKWFNVVGVYPSNADVWWVYKNENEKFDPRTTLHGMARSFAAAPKGRFILEVYNQDRTAVSGISGLTAVTTSFQRASTSAFFAGRVFYSGINYPAFSSSIYFSQIIEPGTTDRFGKCYQKADPTSEDLFDLLPDDGGVIKIPDAGTIVKLWSMVSGLLVFATNGIWLISGSQGIGFTANDYTVQKIASYKTISATSFVDIAGLPAWWAAEGIYTLVSDNGLQIVSMTDNTIFDFYQTIPLVSKKQARGFYNLITKKVQWLYRSTAAGTVDEIYEYDRILNYNALTKAFNPWTISTSSVKVHGVVVGDTSTGSISNNQVIDNSSNTVINDAGDSVIALQINTSVAAIPTFKYLASFASGGSHSFTVVEENDGTNYKDFFSFDSVGVNYTSYFITGFKVHGQAQHKFQANYIYIFSNVIPSQYNFQAIWDYANTGDSGSWSSQAHQTVVNDNVQYDIRRNRLKVRGEGLALQYKIYSVPGQPFSIIGWSAWETGNASV